MNESKETDRHNSLSLQNLPSNAEFQPINNAPNANLSKRQQSVLQMQQTHGNSAVRRMIAQTADPAINTRHRAEEDENGQVISDRMRPVQRDGDAGAPAPSGDAGAIPAQATTPFPTIAQIRADATVERERAADWTAGQSDYRERFGWVMWDRSSSVFSVTGKATGTEDGVTPSAMPADSGTVFRVGEYHQHPPLRPGRDGSRFPVGPSQDDTDGANAAGAPGVVRDFTDRARTTVTDYNYGPNRRT